MKRFVCQHEEGCSQVPAGELPNSTFFPLSIDHLFLTYASPDTVARTLTGNQGLIFPYSGDEAYNGVKRLSTLFKTISKPGTYWKFSDTVIIMDDQGNEVERVEGEVKTYLAACTECGNGAYLLNEKEEKPVKPQGNQLVMKVSVG